MKRLKNWSEAWHSGFGGSFLPLLDLYLARELFSPFLLSVGLFSSLGVAIGNLSDLANKVVDSDLPLAAAIEILLLKVPEFTAYSLPIAVLLATLLAYGRLSNDSELLALRSCGISLYRLVAPAIVLSLVVAIIAFFLNESVVPAANYRATSILVESIHEEHQFWQTKDIFYPDYEEVKLPNGEKIRKLKSLFYAERFDGEKMQTLTIMQWLEQSLSQIVVSDSATWNKKNHTWDFFNGIIYQISPDASYRNTRPFDHYQLALSRIPFELAVQSRDPYEMNIRQAQEYIKLLKLIDDEKKLATFQVRTQQKMAFPFICLVFGLVGATLGCGPRQMGRATSFGLSVAIVFFYYVLAFLMGSLGTGGVLPPLLAGWLPIVAGLGLGSCLLYRFAR